MNSFLDWNFVCSYCGTWERKGSNPGPHTPQENIVHCAVLALEWIFLKIYLFLFYVHWNFACVCEGVGSPGAGVTNGYELPTMCMLRIEPVSSGRWTSALNQERSHLSSPTLFWILYVAQTAQITTCSPAPGSVLLYIAVRLDSSFVACKVWLSWCLLAHVAPLAPDSLLKKSSMLCHLHSGSVAACPRAWS